MSAAPTVERWMKYRWLTPWIIAAAGFTIVNLVLWRGLAAPAKAEASEMRMLVQTAAEIPGAQSTLRRSDEVIQDMAADHRLFDSLIALMDSVRQSALRHEIDLDSLRKNDSRNSAATAKNRWTRESISIRAAGSFNQLVLWLDEMQARPDLRIHSFNIKGSGAKATLDLRLEALLLS